MLKKADNTNSNNLPDPDQFSGRNVVIWDGQCNFCRGQVGNLYRLDWTGKLAFISLHDPRVAERYPQLTPDQLMEQMWLITPEGQQYGGSDAVGYLCLKMPTLWLLAPIMHFPFSKPLWRSLYRWVANRRYRIAGKNCESGTCNLHVRSRR